MSDKPIRSKPRLPNLKPCQCGETKTTSPLSTCYKCPCGVMMHTQYDILLHHGHKELA